MKCFCHEINNEVVVASEMGDDIMYRAREVKCPPAPPLNEKPRAFHTFDGTEPGRRSPI